MNEESAAGMLNAALNTALPKLRALSDEEAGAARGPGKWSRKVVLGHLIDSAANNHQRFVRAPRVERYVGPGYEQEAWVAAQGYRDRPWRDLLALWEALNRHLVHVMSRVPADRLQTECVIGDNPPATLEWVMKDYTRHLEHHLKQIL
jgi:hypothetical protein